jgi:hypothetical protein
VIAQLDIDDSSPSKPASRSQSPSTPAEPSFNFTSPVLSRVNGLATPASSAFHRRARVSGGSLVDSPYDPFVGERRKDGEPKRKRARRSWGTEGRWKLHNQIPSPTKDTTESTWLADAERDFSEPDETPLLSSPVVPEVAVSNVETIKSQFSQELVDRVTEEDSDLEGIGEMDETFDKEVPQEPEEPSLRRSQFAVFRDEPMPAPQHTFTSKSEAMLETSNTTTHTVALDQREQFGSHQIPTSPPPVSEDSTVQVASESVENEPASSMSTEQQDLGHLVDPSLSRLPFDSSQMPSPMLPSIQTSGFGFGFGQSFPMGPPSALPGSPKTPDLRPQQSASLPLPSPFPGDNLATSYMYVQPGSQVPPNLFEGSRRSSATLVPDHLFGFGFGYGSGGLVPNTSLAFPDTASHSFQLAGHESVDEQVDGPFPQDNVTYQQLNLESLSSESIHFDEKTHAISIDPHLDYSSNQEGPSPYPENMPSVLTDRPVDLERTHDPIGLEAYKEFIHEQDDEIQPQKEPSNLFQHDVEANQSSDAMMYQAAASEAIIFQSSSPNPPLEATGSTPSAPIVIDLLSSSESESNSDSDDDVEIEEQQKSVMDVDFAKASDSEEEDENDYSSERLSDEFSDDDSQVASVQDDEGDSEEQGSEAAEDHDSNQDSLLPRTQGEAEIRDFDGTFDSPLQAYPTGPFSASQPNETQPPPPALARTISSTPPATLRSSVVIDLGSESENDSDNESNKEEERSKDTILSVDFPEDADEDIVMTKTDDGNEDWDETHIVTRPPVTFAPRVTRAQAAAAANDQSNTQPELSSSAPSQDSQRFKPTGSVIADSFQGAIHSFGSSTTAAPSNDFKSDDLQKATPLPLYPELPSAMATERSGSGSETQSYPTTKPSQSGVDSNLPMTPDASQHTISQHILQPPEQQSTLPPTPQMTQGSFSQPLNSQVATEESTSQELDMEEVKAEPATQIPPGSPRRSSTRTGEIASIISAWFTPRRTSQGFTGSSTSEDKEIPTQMSETLRGDASVSPRPFLEAQNRKEYQLGLSSAQPTKPLESENLEEKIRDKGKEVEEMVEKDIPLESKLPPNYSLSQTKKSPTKGLLTPLSYYTPLSNLATRLNVPASQSYRDPGIDLLVVVSKSSTPPQRAEKGPRDYFTTLSVTDAFLWPRSVRVQVFRPWKAALPRAEKGDAILLRGFEVLSTKAITGFGLKSGEDAAWCVWRFETVSGGALDDRSKPLWARRENERNAKGSRPREETRGPPVEIGEEEREHVRELRGWWGELEKEAAAVNAPERFEHGESLVSKAG